MKISQSFRTLSIGSLLTWIGPFVTLPILMVLVISFLHRNESDFVSWKFTLENYQRVFDPLYLKVFGNSLLLSLITTVSCLLLAYPFAYAMTLLPSRRQQMALILVVVPFWTNSLLRTYAIKILLGNQGPINSLLIKLSFIEGPLNMLYTPFAVLLGSTYIFFPFMVLPLYAALEKLPKDLIEAAQDLGASPLNIFRKIILPLTTPGILAGSLLVFLPCLGQFYVSDLLGGSQTLLLGTVVRGKFLESRDWPFGSAISMGLIIAMVLMLGLYLLSKRRLHQEQSNAK